MSLFLLRISKKGGLTNMGTIKENYEMMFTSYPDLVNIKQ